MNRASEKFYGKQLVQEYEDLLNYCKVDNRAFPINWYKVMEILETRKLPRHCWGFYDSLILGYYHHYSVKQKVERFHKQIRYGAFMTHNSTHFKKLKDFLMSLKKDEWSYKWLDDCRNVVDISPFYPRHRLNS